MVAFLDHIFYNTHPSRLMCIRIAEWQNGVVFYCSLCLVGPSKPSGFMVSVKGVSETLVVLFCSHRDLEGLESCINRVSFKAHFSCLPSLLSFVLFGRELFLDSPFYTLFFVLLCRVSQKLLWATDSTFGRWVQISSCYKNLFDVVGTTFFLHSLTPTYSPF